MASEDDQSHLDRWSDPDELFGDVRDYLGGLYGRVVNSLEDVGLDLDWWGESPFDLDPDDEVWVYQFVEAYSQGRLGSRYNFGDPRGKRPARTGSPAPEVQFKVGIFVVGQPTDEIEERLRQVDTPRLVTAFDTREYAGYMTGFGFTQRSTYIQREQVSARQVDDKGVGLGIPWFEVEAYDEDGSLEGFADGHFNPFTTETTFEEIIFGEEPPEQEVWSVRTSLNRARNAGGQWEIGPRQNTAASERARTPEMRGKDVYIGPFHIGKITSRGTVWLRREYENGGPYTDKATIVEQSGIPTQALQKGARLYKFEETEDAVRLSTTEPPTGFQPIEAGDVSPAGVGVEVTSQEITEILLDEDEPTQFVIETDENRGRLLGLYSTPAVRDIERGTRLV